MAFKFNPLTGNIEVVSGGGGSSTNVIEYRGTWDAGTNTPTLSTPDITKATQGYWVSAPGTQFGENWVVGDWLVYDSDGVIERRPNNSDVISVNTKTGVVILNTEDIPETGGKIFFTEAEKTKLTGIEESANNYTHPATHPASIIVTDADNRFVTDIEKGVWGGKLSDALSDGKLYGRKNAAWEEIIGGGGVTELADLTDVDVTGITDGQVLVWDTATSKFIPGDGGTSGSTAYVFSVAIADWVADGLKYKITVLPAVHGQGENGYLFTLGFIGTEQTLNEVSVTAGGVVTIYTDSPFDGYFIISNLGSGSGGVTELADLTDVNVTGITDGQVLVWDTTTSKFIPADNGSGGVTELADLTDVNVTGITDGQVLVWDTTTSKYIPYTIPVGGVTELADLTDVNVTGITDGQVLVWDTTTSKYIPADNGSGGGGIPEAPVDSKLYGRKDTFWIQAVDMDTDQLIAGSKTLTDTLQVFDITLDSQMDDGSRLTISHASNSPNVDSPVHLKLYSAPEDMQPTEINHGVVSSSTVGSSYVWTQSRFRDKPAVDTKENMDFTNLTKLATLSYPTIDGSNNSGYARKPILATNGLLYFTPTTTHMVSFNPTTLEQVKITFPATISGNMQAAYDINTNRIYFFNGSSRQISYYNINSNSWSNFGTPLSTITDHTEGFLVINGGYLYVVYLSGTWYDFISNNSYHRISLLDGSSEVLPAIKPVSGYLVVPLNGSPLIVNNKLYVGGSTQNRIGCLDLITGVATVSSSSVQLASCTILGIIDGTTVLTQRSYVGTNYPIVGFNLDTMSITSTYTYPPEMTGVLPTGENRLGLFGYVDEENKKFYRLTGLWFNDGVDRTKPAIEVLDYLTNTWSFIDLGDKIPTPHAYRNSIWSSDWITKDSVGTLVGGLYVESTGDVLTADKGYMFTMLPINTAGVGDVKPVYKINPDGGTVEVGNIDEPGELALQVRGKSILSPRVDVGFQELNNGLLTVWGTAKVSSSAQVGNNSSLASSALVGSIRYREDTDYSYVDICMRVSTSEYAWINLLKKGRSAIYDAWSIVPTPGATDLYSIAWSPDLECFCAAGSAGIVYSVDGYLWQTVLIGDVFGIIWNEDLGVFYAYDVNETPVYTSSNGTTWNTGVSTIANDGVIWVPTVSKYFAFNALDGLSSSPDGLTWTLVNADTTMFRIFCFIPTLNRLVFSNGYSDDYGVTILPISLPATISSQGIYAHSPTLGLTVRISSSFDTYTSNICTSTDGITWTDRGSFGHPLDADDNYEQCIWDATLSKFILVGKVVNSGVVYSSSDGIVWSKVTSFTYAFWNRSVAYSPTLGVLAIAMQGSPGQAIVVTPSQD